MPAPRARVRGHAGGASGERGVDQQAAAQLQRTQRPRRRRQAGERVGQRIAQEPRRRPRVQRTSPPAAAASSPNADAVAVRARPAVAGDRHPDEAGLAANRTSGSSPSGAKARGRALVIEHVGRLDLGRQAREPVRGRVKSSASDGLAAVQPREEAGRGAGAVGPAAGFRP